MDAPIPPNNTNLQHNYTLGSEVEFDGFVRYQCLSGHKFNHDYYFRHFDIVCTNGTWLYEGNNMTDHEWFECTKPSGTVASLSG